MICRTICSTTYFGTIEMTSMMCDYYEHTGDREFLREVLLPCADKFIRFYELHYPKAGC